MGIRRKERWPSILLDEIEKSKSLAFEYGKNDCTIWAANTISKYTDLDWKPSWTNKKQAIKYHNSIKMEEEVSKVLGPAIGNILLTQRGDLVQKGTGINSALGICIGSQVVFLYDKQGICYIPLQECNYSWRI